MKAFGINKKRTAILFLCLFGTVRAMAQASLCGKVIDKDNQEPVPQATIQLFSLPDSTFAQGMVSGNDGVFRFSPLKKGAYLLKVSYIGYEPYWQQADLKANTRLDLKEILLKPASILLNETVIVAEAPPVTMEQDTTVFNTSAYRVAEGSMLEDLVKKLPGVEVDSDGTITVNGKEIKRIMVDGKEFFSDDPQLAMKNLPVEIIEKVKAYDKKSDLARVTGIDDGEEEAVLDLSVKKEMKKGWFGNLIAGYGSQERYEGGAMANRFNDRTQVSVIASANNTNNQGFSEFGDAGAGMGGNAGNGINTSQALAVNFSHHKEKIEMGGDVRYGHSQKDAWTKSHSENYLEDGSYFIDSRNNSGRGQHSISGNFRMEWKPDTLTNIIFRPSASYSKTSSRSHGTSATLDNLSDSINAKQSDSHGRSNSLSARGNLQINRRLQGKPGRNITLRLNYNYNASGSDQWSYTDTRFYQNDSISQLFRYNDGESSNNSYRIQMAYIEPILTNRFLQFSYSYQYRTGRSQKYVHDTDEEGMPAVRLDSLSDQSTNRYMTHELQASFRTIREKYMYNVGISIAPQKSATNTTLGPNAKGRLTQNVWNYSPTFDFRYRFSKQEQLRLMYRGNSSAPDIEDLQAVKDVTDPMNLVYGNPSLKPSYNNRLMIHYNRYSMETQRGMMANFSFNNTINSTTNKVAYNPETGGKVTNIVNVNGNWNTRLFYSFNTPFKNKKFTFNTYTNAYYQNMVGFNSVDKAEAERSTTRSLNLFERLRANYRDDRFGIGLAGSIRYNFSRNSTQEKNNRETFDYGVEANANVTLPWDIYLSTDINCSIKSGYGEGFDKNIVLWNAQVSRNFLKKKQATLRFKIYDILQQRSSISRTITANYIQDSESSTLGSYFMVHFVYRLNTWGKGRPAAGGAPPRPGGPPPHRR